jgi:hypothetical protein
VEAVAQQAARIIDFGDSFKKASFLKKGSWLFFPWRDERTPEKISGTGVIVCTQFIDFDHQTVAIAIVTKRKLFSLTSVLSGEDQPLNCKFAVS